MPTVLDLRAKVNFAQLHRNDLLSLEKMTQSDTSEYAWNQQTTVSLTEPSPNLCLITYKQSPDTEVQDDQNKRYYVNSTIGPQTFPQLDHSCHII